MVQQGTITCLTIQSASWLSSLCT